MLSVMRDTWINLLRKLSLAVSFPVGLGSGLLPKPMVLLPPEDKQVEQCDESHAQPIPAGEKMPRHL